MLSFLPSCCIVSAICSSFVRYKSQATRKCWRKEGRGNQRTHQWSGLKQGDSHSLRWPYIGPRARSFTTVAYFLRQFLLFPLIPLLFTWDFASICYYCSFTILISSLILFRAWDLLRNIPPECCTVVLFPFLFLLTLLVSVCTYIRCGFCSFWVRVGLHSVLPSFARRLGYNLPTSFVDILE